MKALENPFSKLKSSIKIVKVPRIQQELAACLQCGYCISVCEAHNQTPWESVTPRGKIYYLRQLSNAGSTDKLLGREVSLSPYFVDAMYKCTGCGNCEVVCHANIPLVEFWETVRKWMVDEGVGPMSAHKGMAAKVGEVHNPYGEPPSKRGDWWPAEVERSSTPDVMFFAGCTGAYRQQNLPQIGVRVLARAGVKVNTLGSEEWCCSSPLLRTGTHKYSLECAEKVVEGTDGAGAKDMVMTCSGCYKTVSTDFGKFYAKTGQNVYHFSQYVEKLIAERKLPLNHEFKAKVTYHDPCHMGRHMGVFDAPRNVMKKIKGLELVEMERSRENSRCCGAGGGYKSQYNDLAVNIAAERIRDAEETGAEILITCCPFCVVNLTQGAKKIGSKIKIMDLAEVLLKVTAPIEKPAEDAKSEPQKEKPKEVSPEAAEAERARLAAAEKARLAALERERAAAEEREKRAALERERAAAEERERQAQKDDVLIIRPDTDDEEEEEFAGEDIWTDNSPEALVRRAAWNKGLRCRKDYGPSNIPVAFVKPKVAVYILEEGKVDAAAKQELEDEGWIVLSFLKKDITDGEDQAVEIKAAVKENRKAHGKKKRR
ncbi:MAG: heterodisulfide reductase-related iron-sulfur binding cluster [Methanomassiliicoccaceae archaeon]|nr:heterodisulfide reductase-related iron-sulfur binding cluster [Methanomassiliicoccaceae archaeon]